MSCQSKFGLNHSVLLDKDSEVLEPRMKNIGNALFKDK